MKTSRLIAILAKHLADYGDCEVKTTTPEGLVHPVARCWFKPAGFYLLNDDEKAIVISTD